MTESTIPVADVVAVFTRRNGTADVIVLCPYGQHRHRHPWERDEAPGIRRAHCGQERFYRIGPVPAPHLMDAVRLVRQAGGWMTSRPWTKECTPDQLQRITAAARNLAAQIAATTGWTGMTGYPTDWIDNEEDDY